MDRRSGTAPPVDNGQLDDTAAMIGRAWQESDWDRLGQIAVECGHAAIGAPFVAATTLRSDNYADSNMVVAQSGAGDGTYSAYRLVCNDQPDRISGVVVVFFPDQVRTLIEQDHGASDIQVLGELLLDTEPVGIDDAQTAHPIIQLQMPAGRYVAAVHIGDYGEPDGRRPIALGVYRANT
jgi:hypothetical protein